MWSFRVVVSPPFFDDDLRFPYAVEDLSVEQFVSEPAIEALAVAVLPGASWLDVSRLSANCRNSVSDSLSNELRTVVRTDEGRCATQDEQVS